jgi:hypothetical protein
MKRDNVLRMVRAVADRTLAKPLSKAAQAYNAMLKDALKDKDWTRLNELANVQYKANMPRLDTLDHIREYIACVAEGVVLGVFTGTEASKLLYAAQIALSSYKSADRRVRCKARKIRKVA